MSERRRVRDLEKTTLMFSIVRKHHPDRWINRSKSYHHQQHHPSECCAQFRLSKKTQPEPDFNDFQLPYSVLPLKNWAHSCSDQPLTAFQKKGQKNVMAYYARKTLGYNAEFRFQQIDLCLNISKIGFLRVFYAMCQLPTIAVFFIKIATKYNSGTFLHLQASL